MDSFGATAISARSFLRKFLRRTGNSLVHRSPDSPYARPTTNLTPTTYLDGLRGLVTTSVVIFNICHAIDENWTWGDGFGIPLLFVLSGNVLSLKPIQQVRGQEWEHLLETISSRTIRVALRTYIPAMAATLLAFFVLRLNLYDFSTRFHKPTISAVWNLPAWSGQLMYLLKEDFAFLHLLRWTPTSSKILPTLWILQTLMRGPLVLSLTIIGLSRSWKGIRYFVVVVLMLASYRSNQLEMMSMLGGLLLAEMQSAVLEKDKLELEPQLLGKIRQRMLGRVGLCLSIVLLLVPGTCTANSFSLCSIVPKARTALVHHLAALLFVWSASTSMELQSMLITTTMQDLGRLSYSIYLVHGPILESVGYRYGNRVLGSMENLSTVRYTMGILSTVSITCIATFFAATAFWKYIELPVVSLLRSLESISAIETRSILLPTDNAQKEKFESAPTPGGNQPVHRISSQSKASHLPISSETGSFVSKLLWFMLPSFVQDYLDPGFIEKKVHPTAWLDGLRGFAALFVFWYHLMNPFHPNHLDGYGYNPKGSYLIQLPILRLVYSGNVMVYIFFVISGYVLSIKPITQIRSGRSHLALLTTLSSSIFRRAIRLAIPPLVSTFINMLLVQAGVFGPTQSVAKDADILPGYREPHLRKLDSFSAQFWDWLVNARSLTTMFPTGAAHSRYDPHSWTINVEFRCSMLVFLYLVCFAKTKTWIRISFCCITSYFLWQVDAWHENMFILGVLVAEINQTQSVHFFKSAESPFGEKKSSLGQRRRLLWWFIFFVALFLASTPERSPWDVFGYRSLVRIVWMRNFWNRFGCPLLVFSISNSVEIQALFSNRLARILANLSFSCYLMHYLTIHTIAYAIVPALWKVFGNETTWGYEGSFILGSVIVTVVTMWLSDVFWRAVDVPSVRFARWLENQCLISSQKRA